MSAGFAPSRPEQEQAPRKNHTFTADNRRNIVLTGIEEVTSYDSGAIVATCGAGQLVLQGKQLHIGSFDRVSGKLTVDGTLDILQYIDVRDKSKSIFSRLLK